MRIDASALLLVLALSTGVIGTTGAAVTNRATGAAAEPAVVAGVEGLESCSERVARQPDSEDAHRCFLRVARHTGDFEGAGRRVEALLAVAPDSALARYALASLEAWQGRARAEALYRQAAETFERDGNVAFTVGVHLDLSLFLAGRGQLQAAAEELTAAEAAAIDSGDAAALARVRTAQGKVAFRQGDYERASDLLRGVEQDLFPDGPPFARAAWLSAMGAVHWSMGRDEEALGCYRRQAGILGELGDLYEEATALSNVVLLASQIAGRLDSDRGSPPWDEVRRVLDEAVDRARRGRNRNIEAKSTLYLAQLEADVEQRRHYYRAALRILDETLVLEDRLLALRLLGETLVIDEPRHPEEGFELLARAIDVARSHGALESVARGAITLATARWRELQALGDDPDGVERALTASREAFTAVEQLRDRQRDDLARARVFTRFSFFYDRVVGNLLQPAEVPPTRERLELAYTVLERRRSRVLLDELDAAGVTAAMAAGEPRQEARMSLLDDIARLNRELMNPRLGDDRRQAVLDELEGVEREEAMLRDDLARSGSPLADVREREVPELTTLEASLGQQRAMLSFQIADEWSGSGMYMGSSWLFVHTAGESRVYPLPGAREIESRVRLLLGLIGHRDGSEEAGASALFRDLLEEPLGDLPETVTELVVIPDGPLQRLPFGMLRVPRDGAALGSRYRISVAPSVTTWLRWRSPGRRADGSGILALADPDLPMTGIVEPAEERSVLKGLGPLPLSRSEVRSLARYLGGPSRIAVGSSASESLFKTSCRAGCELVHVAAHALVDERRPARSSIVLSPGSTTDDGLLQPRELVGLDLSGSVVVLSGCKSAGGVLLQGEGVLSLARSFFVAGSPAVIGSVWPLRDDDAAWLFDAFYRHVGAGASLSEALRRARLERIEAGAPTAAWAGVVLLGDGGIVLRPDGRAGLPGGWRPWLAGALALAGVLAAVAAGRRCQALA